VTDHEAESLGVRQLLDKVCQNSQFAWWEWDIDRNIVTASPLKVEMLGYRHEDFVDAGYQAYTDLLHPSDYERTMQAMRDHLEGRAPLYQVDYRIKRADGRYTWYMDRGCILERHADGSPALLRGIVVDLGAELSRHVSDEAVVALVRQALPCAGGGPDLVHLCSSCHRLQIGEGAWVTVGERFAAAFPTTISHCICRECMLRLYPDFFEEHDEF
jgi:PAS domain S-box-containing protein